MTNGRSRLFDGSARSPRQGVSLYALLLAVNLAAWNLVGDKLGLKGAFWEAIGAVYANSGWSAR